MLFLVSQGLSQPWRSECEGRGVGAERGTAGVWDGREQAQEEGPGSLRESIPLCVGGSERGKKQKKTPARPLILLSARSAANHSVLHRVPDNRHPRPRPGHHQGASPRLWSPSWALCRASGPPGLGVCGSGQEEGSWLRHHPPSPWGRSGGHLPGKAHALAIRFLCIRRQESMSPMESDLHISQVNVRDKVSEE